MSYEVERAQAAADALILVPTSMPFIGPLDLTYSFDEGKSEVERRYDVRANSPEVDELDVIMRERVRAQRLQREADHRTSILENLGEDDHVSSTIIAFKKKFTPNGVAYTYAAIKRADGKWATTSTRHTDALTWDELTLFLVGGQVPTESYDVMVPYVAPEADSAVDTARDSR